MYLTLLFIGLLATAGGFAAIGFGIPINAFSLGHTLIVAGSTSVAGGLVLMGLALVVRQLRRLTAIIEEKLVVYQPARLPEPSEPLAAPPPTPAPTPGPELAAQREAPHSFEPPAHEPSETESPASSDSAVPSRESRGPLHWLRPGTKASPTAEPLLPDVVEETSPLPRQPDRNETPQRAAPGADRSRDTGLFDVAWPDPKSPAPPVDAHTSTRSAGALRPGPGPTSSRRAAPVVDRAPAILKSGVIDGMAYTLYADGSIEAELPQGTLNFVSVDELRAHLEKHGG